LTILVTGAAGFIGFHTALALLRRGETVVGVDNLNPYYDVRLKERRLEQLLRLSGFSFAKADVADRTGMLRLVSELPDLTGIVHLAAQAGVRYSLENPYAYVESNVMGQVVMMEAARQAPKLRHLVYASSSSVYGGNTELPFSVEHRVDKPISPYAATKRACELLAYTYSHVYRLPTTGLRFFTVYGPWGRPDMAAYLFCEAILNGRPIQVFNRGRMRRDFTYIDDIVAGVVAALERPPADTGAEPPYRVYNLGNSKTEELGRFIDLIEEGLGRKAIREMLPLHPADLLETSANVDESRRDLGYDPRTPIEEGLSRFLAWYLDYTGGTGRVEQGLPP
jgi:UDP-glucuronate 4-epimerase